MTKLIELENRIRSLERMLAKIPARFLGVPASASVCELLTGVNCGHQLVASDGYGSALYGVDRSSTRVSTLTTDVDPSGTGAISQSGVGRGLLKNSDGTTTPCLVIADDRMLFVSPVPEGQRILCSVASISASGGPARVAAVVIAS